MHRRALACLAALAALSIDCGFPGYAFEQSQVGVNADAGGGGGAAGNNGGSAAGEAGAPSPDSCSDGRTNGSETDIDCGGSCPEPCGVGFGCLRGDRDCASGVCGSDGTCSAATCDDGVQNGPESDVDCGGGKCSQCPPLANCNAPENCASNLCTQGRCDAGLRAYYVTHITDTNSTRVRPEITLKNEGTSSAPLSHLSVRYYFTASAEDPSPIVISESSANQSGAGGGDISALTHFEIFPISPVFEADSYLEVSFPTATTSLPPGEAVAAYVSLSFSDGAPLTQTNDYSFDATATVDVPDARIPIYLDGRLIYGSPPGQ